MKDSSEFSDTPTADAAEAFLNQQETRVNPSEQGTLLLYADAKRLTETLQKAAQQGNLALDREIMIKDFYLDLEGDHNSHQETLDAIKKGEISVAYWPDQTGGGCQQTPSSLLLD